MKMNRFVVSCLFALLVVISGVCWFVATTRDSSLQPYFIGAFVASVILCTVFLPRSKSKTKNRKLFSSLPFVLAVVGSFFLGILDDAGDFLKKVVKKLLKKSTPIILIGIIAFTMNLNAQQNKLSGELNFVAIFNVDDPSEAASIYVNSSGRFFVLNVVPMKPLSDYPICYFTIEQFHELTRALLECEKITEYPNEIKEDLEIFVGNVSYTALFGKGKNYGEIPSELKISIGYYEYEGEYLFRIIFETEDLKVKSENGEKRYHAYPSKYYIYPEITFKPHIERFRERNSNN